MDMATTSNLSYISARAVVKESAIHGKGLFAREQIAKDEVVCIKGGYYSTRSSGNQFLIAASQLRICFPAVSALGGS